MKPINRELYRHTQRLRNEMETPDFYHEHKKWHKVDTVITIIIVLIIFYVAARWLM